jgi:tight adherence protein C
MVLYAVIILALVIFIASGAFFLFGSSREETSEVFRRFKEVTGYQQDSEAGPEDIDEELLEGTYYERVIHPFIERVANLLGGDEESKREKLEKELIQAGRPGNLGPNEFVAMQLVLGLLGVSLVTLISLLVAPTSRRGVALAVVFAAVAGVAAYIVPKFLVSKWISDRQTEVKLSLPFAIDLLVVSAEAGLGFDMAMNRVTEKMDGALSDEFKRTMEEVKLGTPRKTALKNMTDRVEVEELDSFVSAVIQAEELGASIGEVLRIQADQIRTRRRQTIEEEAQKAPVKMLIPMVLFIFPTIFIVVLGPVGLKLYEEFKSAPI